ncbi:hypothetical protein C8F04DRAFT_1175851 [Mycena alexandri]|uniref:Uncharacterized protein n=1 Tax=Mycena alexandri TaxID=1745969 RepID=A0AAD6TCA9_9AGAR|nr:hypothetical protein C8F04DRAFT_1175851 [Mycena alexandri]
MAPPGTNTNYLFARSSKITSTPAGKNSLALSECATTAPLFTCNTCTAGATGRVLASANGRRGLLNAKLAFLFLVTVSTLTSMTSRMPLPALDTTALTGSSRAKPWIFDERDQLVLSDTTNQTSKSVLKRESSLDTRTVVKRESSRDTTRNEQEPDIAHGSATATARTATADPTTSAVDPPANAHRHTLLGNHAIGGPTFVEWLPKIPRESTEGLTFIEQHAADLAWSSRRASVLRKARQHSDMMHPGVKPYQRERSPSTENDENVALRRNYQLRPRHRKKQLFWRAKPRRYSIEETEQQDMYSMVDDYGYGLGDTPAVVLFGRWWFAEAVERRMKRGEAEPLEVRVEDLVGKTVDRACLNGQAEFVAQNLEETRFQWVDDRPARAMGERTRQTTSEVATRHGKEIAIRHQSHQLQFFLTHRTASCSRSLGLWSLVAPFIVAPSSLVSSMSQSRKKAKAPAMVVGSTVFSVTSRSTNGRTIRTHTGTFGQDVGSSSGLGSDRFWEDDIATNIARAATTSFSYHLGDPALESQLDDPVDNGINVVLCSAPAQKKPARPLHQFYPLEDKFVAESLRREGRGSARVHTGGKDRGRWLSCALKAHPSHIHRR